MPVCKLLGDPEIKGGGGGQGISHAVPILAWLSISSRFVCGITNRLFIAIPHLRVRMY